MKRPLALITGGTSGIGLACARLLREDYQLALIFAHNQERAAAVEREMGACCFQADISDASQLAGCLAALPSLPDALVNAAGIASAGQFFLQRRELQPLEQMMRVNYLGSLAVIAGLLPAMLKRGSGVIVNIASASSLGANPGLIGYSESKAALRCLSKNLASELAGTGISVHCLSPARVASPMTEGWLHKAQPQSINYPLGRALQGKEAALAVRQLLRAGSLLNGLDLVLDGGHSLSRSSEPPRTNPASSNL